MPASKKGARSAAYVELEHEDGFERFHCPVCGEPILIPEEGITEKPCKHVVLIHDWVGEFHPRDKKVEKLIDKAEEKDGNTIELLRKSFAQNVVFFEFLEPGNGPKAPAAITVVVDMDLAAAGV